MLNMNIKNNFKNTHIMAISNQMNYKRQLNLKVPIEIVTIQFFISRVRIIK